MFGQEFINLIKSIDPSAKAVAGNREIRTRCPFCGDSENKSHAHFYMKVPQDNNELSFYECKRAICGAKGVVNAELLRKLGCTDSNTIVEVEQHNSVVMKTPKFKTLKVIDIYPLMNDYIRESELNQYKLGYINLRLGSSFTYQDILSLKIFLNLGDVISRNRLELTRSDYTIDFLDKYFIGFISHDNSYCGLRKIVSDNVELPENINMRYVNYVLVNKNDNKKNFYTIPSRVDFFNPSPMNIHIAEGQFDILGVFHNIMHCERVNNIYAAACGKSYLNVLSFILTTIGLINFNVHLYPDKDVSDYVFKSVVQSVMNIRPGIKVYIHRNMYPGEKDFGVPANRIKDYVEFGESFLQRN